MSQNGAPNDTVLRVRIEGAEQATRLMQQLREEGERLQASFRGGASGPLAASVSQVHAPVGGAGANGSFYQPPTAAQPPPSWQGGFSGYSMPALPAPMQSAPSTMEMVLRQAMGGHSLDSAAALMASAPSMMLRGSGRGALPPGGGSYDGYGGGGGAMVPYNNGLPASGNIPRLGDAHLNGMGPGSAQSASVTIIAREVVIHAQSVSMGGAGGGGYGGGSGTVIDGTTGQVIGGGGGGFQPLYSQRDTQTLIKGGGGGGYDPSSAFLRNVAGGGNPLQAAYGAVVGGLGLAGGAAVGGLYYAAKISSDATLAGEQVQWDVSNRLAAASAAGNPIPGIRSEAMQRMGTIDATMARNKTFARLFDWWPSENQYLAENAWQPQTLQRDLIQSRAGANSQYSILASLGMGSYPVGDSGGIPASVSGDWSGQPFERSDTLPGRGSKPWGTGNRKYIGAYYPLAMRARSLGGDFAGNLFTDSDMEDLQRLYQDSYPDLAGNAVDVITQMARNPENISLRKRAIGYKGKHAVDDLSLDALRIAAGSGDLGAISAIEPMARRLPGGKQAVEDAYDRAHRVVDFQGNAMLQQSNIGMAGSALQTAQAQGGGYTQVSSLISTMNQQIGLMLPILAGLQKAAADSGNPVEAAKYSAEIASAKARQASNIQMASQVEIGQRSGILSNDSGFAQLNTQRVMMGGGNTGSVLGAMGKEAAQSRRRARVMRELSRLPGLSAVDRQNYELQAEQAEFEAGTGNSRRQAEYSFGMAQSGVGMAQAGVDFQSQQAQLFGGVNEAYSASMAGVAPLQAARGAAETLMHSPGRTAQEQLDLAKQILDLRRQEVGLVEQSTREQFNGAMRVAQAYGSIAEGGMRNAFAGGIGGAGGIGYAGANEGAATRTLTAAQRTMNYYQGLVKSGRMSTDNSAYTDAQQGLQAAQSGVLSARAAATQIPFDSASSLRGSQIQFTSQLARAAWVPWQDQQANFRAGLSNVGDQLHQLQQQESAFWRDPNNQNLSPEEHAHWEKMFFDRKAGLGTEALGYQSGIMNGWQDRLTSSVVGQNSNFSSVSGQFSARMSAGFLQNITPAFGFTSKETRDGWMFRAPRIASSLIGYQNTPAGFSATAAAIGGVGGPGNVVSLAPGTVIEIIDGGERKVGRVRGPAYTNPSNPYATRAPNQPNTQNF